MPRLAVARIKLTPGFSGVRCFMRIDCLTYEALNMPQENPFAGFDVELSEPAEPWFYGFLSAYAKTAMVVAIGITVGVALFAIGAYAYALSTIDMPPAVAFTAGAAVAGLAVMLMLVLVAVLFQVALLLLAVDAGRSLRRIKANTRP
jgi:hypothetical protein